MLLEKLQAHGDRTWYIWQTIENGWSCNILVHGIESRLHEHQGKAQTDFERKLHAPQSELSRDLLNHPYRLDFLTVGKDAEERVIERRLTQLTR